MRFVVVLGLLLGAASAGCENTAFYRADTRTWFDPNAGPTPAPGDGGGPGQAEDRPARP
jgi:hypothetical protein